MFSVTHSITVGGVWFQLNMGILRIVKISVQLNFSFFVHTFFRMTSQNDHKM